MSQDEREEHEEEDTSIMILQSEQECVVNHEGGQLMLRYERDIQQAESGAAGWAGSAGSQP